MLNPLNKVPAEPDTNWNTLPASLNSTDATALLLSVKEITPSEPETSNVVDPGNKPSLYLFLSTDIT